MPDSPTQRVGGAPAAGFTKVAHLPPMGSLEKVTTGEALEKWADDVRKRLGTGRAGGVRRRAEDRRLGDLAPLRERRLRPRRDARRRSARRGRDAEPPHDRRGPAADPRRRRRRARAARGARRDLLPALAASLASTRRRSPRARSPRRTRATQRPARSGSSTPRSRPSGRCRSGSTASARARASCPATQAEMLDWLREHGFRTNPHAERVETIEEVAEAAAPGRRAAPSSTTRSTAS